MTLLGIPRAWSAFNWLCATVTTCGHAPLCTTRTVFMCCSCWGAHLLRQPRESKHAHRSVRVFAVAVDDVAAVPRDQLVQMQSIDE